jgi:hypothetical protein
MAADGPGGGWLEGRQVRVHRPAGIPSHLVLVAWAVTQLDVCAVMGSRVEDSTRGWDVFERGITVHSSAMQ